MRVRVGEAGTHEVIAEHALHERLDHRHIYGLPLPRAKLVDHRPEHRIHKQVPE